MMRVRFVFASFALMVFAGGSAVAVETGLPDEACQLVRLSDLGKPELVIKTAAAAVVLEALGYTPQTQAFSVKQTFATLANAKIDAFLGADRQKMAKRIKKGLKNGAIELAGVNLRPEQNTALLTPSAQQLGAPETVSSTTGQAGLGQQNAITPTAEQESWKLAAAASANAEQANDKLTEVPAKTDAGAELTSLSDEVLSDPGTNMLSVVRSGYLQACPNVGRFIQNLTFSAEMTEFISIRMAVEYEAPFDGAVAWFDANRPHLEAWLKGVKTIEGTNAMAAVAEEFAF